MTEPDIESTNLSETVVRGASLAGGGYLIAQILTLGFYLVLARLATPRDFGEYAAGAMLVNVGLLFTESGMLAALIHRPDRIEEAASTASVATAASGVLLALLALAVSPLIGHFFQSATIGSISAVMSGMLVVRALPVVPEALIQRRFSFLRRVVVEPVSVLAFGIGAVIACANGLGPWGLVIGYYAAGVADAALSWALVQWRPKLNLVSLSMWRELVRYGRFVLASNVLLRAGGQIPVLVLGRFVSASALGQYRYAGRMTSTSLSLFVQSASYVLFPAFARIANDRVRYRAAALRSLRLLCALAFPFGALLIPLGVPAAVLLFGAVWEDAGFAAMALVGVPLGGTLAAFATEIFKADGRPSILTRLQAIGVVASAVAVLALLPLGLIGVAGGMSIGAVISGAYGLAKSRQLIGLTVGETVEAFIRPAIAAATMAILLTPVQFLLIDAGSHGTFAGLALLAAEAIVGLLIYAGSIRIIAAPVARDVWALVMKMLRRPSNRDATGQLVQPPM